MAKSASGRLSVTLTGSVVKTATGGDLTQAISESIAEVLTNGSGANQFNRYKKVSGTATDTPAAAVDLSGTSTDDFGDTTDLSKVRLILITNTDAANNLIVGGETADLVFLTDPMTLRPGMQILVVDMSATAIVVTATTHDKISVAAESGLTATYEITVLGSA